MPNLVAWKPKSSDRNVASVRFRCLTPLDELRRSGFPIELYSEERDAAGAYSLVIFSKLYGDKDRALTDKLRQRGVKTVLDISDNHFYNPFDLPEYRAAGANMRAMAQQVDRVICCSPHLASIVGKEAALTQAPLVVGDAVEPMHLPAGARDPFDTRPGEPFSIVWFGSHGSPNAPSGMEDLLRIAGRLEHAGKRRSCELVVLSNSREKFDALSPRFPLPSRYREWSEDALMAEFAHANLVVVPITANPFTACKSNNRVATALWHGIPVIADRIPAYDELSAFAVLDDWPGGLELALAIGREMKLRTEAGTGFVRSRFNIRAIGAEWRKALKEILGQPAKVQAR